MLFISRLTIIMSENSKISKFFKPSVKKNKIISSDVIEIVDICSSSSEESLEPEDGDKQGRIIKSVTTTTTQSVHAESCESRKVESDFNNENACDNDDNAFNFAQNPFEKFKFQGKPQKSLVQVQIKNITQANKITKKPKPTNERSNPSSNINELSSSELSRVRQKWHNFSDTDETNLENKRFQILVAARLHARAHEQVVHKAIKALFILFQSKQKTFCVKDMSMADPECITSAISFVHFAKSKATQIVKAACDINCKFDGVVPESLNDLQLITGIGPKIAHILSIVNTYEAHGQS